MRWALTALCIAALAVPAAGFASADPNGNGKNCQGVVTSALASNGFAPGTATQGDSSLSSDIRALCEAGGSPAFVAAYELSHRFTIEIDGLIKFLGDAFGISPGDAQGIIRQVGGDTT